MNTYGFIGMIERGDLDKRFVELYGESKVLFQRERYIGAVKAFAELFGAEHANVQPHSGGIRQK